jgi:hypothetical protein
MASEIALESIAFFPDQAERIGTDQRPAHDRDDFAVSDTRDSSSHPDSEC